MIRDTVNGILLERRNKLLIIKFNNIKKRNALNRASYLTITKALNDAAKDDSITTVAFTGAGDFYSSGNDFGTSALANENEDFEETLTKSMEILKKLIRTIYNFPKLLIAVVNGPCIGIAATTAALCDVIYCSEKAYFFTPFTNLAICPEGCSSYLFPRILGRSKASEMLLLNHKLSAEEALKFNFVSEIFKIENLETDIWPRILKFSELPEASMKVGKQLIKQHLIKDLDVALETEMSALFERWHSQEFFMVMSNFLNKRSKL